MKRANQSRQYKHAIPGAVLIPKDGYYQIRKAGVTAERVKKDAAYHATRLQAREFKQVALQAHLIRNALLNGTGIKQRTCLLNGALKRVLRSDVTHSTGHRCLMNCDLSDLEGYNFNEKAPLKQVFALDTSLSYQPHHPFLTIVIPAFIPSEVMKAPAGVLHARIFAVSASIDFATMTFEVSREQTTLIPIRAITVKETRLCIRVKATESRLQIVALGIQWYSKLRGSQVIQQSKKAGSLAILKAWHC